MNKKEQRELVYKKYTGKCGYCGVGIAYKDMQVDHIIPQTQFLNHLNTKWQVPKFLNHLTPADLNHFDNLMPACRVCNKWKDTHSVEIFRGEIYAQVQRLNLYSTNYRMAKKYSLIQENLKPIVFYFETFRTN